MKNYGVIWYKLKLGMPVEQLNPKVEGPEVNDPNYSYWKIINQIPLLTPAEERALSKRILYARAQEKKDVPAETKFIVSNLRLVVSVAAEYQNRGLDMFDLIQEGNIGLMHAVPLYDYRKGCRFSTYAMPWIRQKISLAIADQGRIIRIPQYKLSQMTSFKRVEKSLLEELERKPTAEEVAERAGASVKDVEECRQAEVRSFSLEKPLGYDGETTLADFIQDPGQDVSELGCSAPLVTSLKRDINTVFDDCLRPREKELLVLYFGLDGSLPKTLEEIGRQFGMTRSRASFIKRNALRKLSSSRSAMDLLRDYL